MQRTYHLLALLLLAQLGFGQDWRPLHANRTAYYDGYTVYPLTVRWTLESSRMDGADSIWYPAPLHVVHHPREDSCYGFTPRPAPFGDSIRVFANGDMDFYYADGDTLHWKADLTLPWVMLRNPVGSNPRQIVATPVGYALGSVLGQPDSLLTLDLALTDSMGVTIHRMSRSSQHHGWLDPVLFARHSSAQEYVVNVPFSGLPGFRGITNPPLGVQNLPKEAFFSMQPGDTIQILEHTSEDQLNEMTDIWQQDIYLARNTSTNGDTIFFTIDRAIFGESNIQALPPPSRVIVIDTIPLNHPAYQRLDRDLGEMYNPDFRASAWVSEWRIHPQFGRLMKPMSLRDTLNEIDTCYTLSAREIAGDMYWESWLLDTYMEGLGGPYWEKGPFGFNQLLTKREVTYFHTSTGQGGSLLNFDSLMSVAPTLPENLFAFSISPNPNHGAFQLHLSEQLSNHSLRIRLYAMDGRLLQELSASRQTVVDVQAHGLAPGVYVVLVETDGYAKAGKAILW